MEEIEVEGDKEIEIELDGVIEKDDVMEGEGEGVGGTQGAQSPLPVGGESHHVGNGQ